MYGIKLRQLRRQLGLTQRQLGTLCGVGGTTISMIEHGKRLPGRETLRRLQAVLGDLPPRPAKPLPTAELLTLLRGVSPCKGQDGPQASPSPAGDGLSGRSPLRRLRRRACGPNLSPAADSAGAQKSPTGETRWSFAESQYLSQPVTIGGGLLRGDENNSARGVGTQHQYLAHKIRDLPGREVDHPQHLYARQVLRAVVVGDLRRGLFYPDLRAEIHRELVGRAAGLGERLRRQDGAHPDIQSGKIFECRQLFFHQMLISLATL